MKNIKHEVLWIIPGAIRDEVLREVQIEMWNEVCSKVLEEWDEMWYDRC